MMKRIMLFLIGMTLPHLGLAQQVFTEEVHIDTQTGTPAVMWFQEGTESRWWLGNLNSNHFGIQNGSMQPDGSHFTIEGGGNVGIGINDPAAKLHVHGPTILLSRDDGPLNGIGIRNENTEEGDREWKLWNFNKYGSNERIGLAIYEYWDKDRDGSACIGEGYCTSRLFIESGGNVGIGTNEPSHKLAVNGEVRAKEITVDNTGWPDFVFDKGYDLPTLEEVATHIAQYGHLPAVPSAEEVAEQGVAVGAMQATLLQKVEELTLYVIEQQRRIQQQQSLIANQQAQITEQQAQNATLLHHLAQLEARLQGLEQQ